MEKFDLSSEQLSPSTSSSPDTLTPENPVSLTPKRNWISMLVLVSTLVVIVGIFCFTVGRTWVAGENTSSSESLSNEEDLKNISLQTLDEEKPANQESTTNTSLTTSNNWQTYLNKKYEYSFDYPNDWKIKSTHSLEDLSEKRSADNAIGIEMYKSDNDQHFWSFAVKVSDYRGMFSSGTEAFKSSSLSKKIFEEKPVMLDDCEAYYGAYETKTAQIKSGDKLIEEAKTVTRKSIFCQQGRSTYELQWTERSVGDNYVPFNQYDEVFDRIISTFEFHIQPEISSLATGCLNFPVKKGNTWRYQVFGQDMGMVANYTDVSTITELGTQEFNIHTDRTGGNFTTAIDRRYTFDPDGKNMFLSMAKTDTKNNQNITLAKGTLSYDGFKFFSCNQSQWPLAVKTFVGDISSEQLGQLGGATASIVGSVKIVDRETEVTVPAGTFQAILVEQVYNQSISTFILENDLTFDVVDRFWYVPQIGIVKEEYSSDKYKSNLVFELTDYKI